MDKLKHTFEEFILNAGKDDQAFYKRINQAVTEAGYQSKVELKKSGYAVSYANKKKKRTLLNFVSRKKGILVRVYGDHSEEYIQYFDSLPNSMKMEIKKGQDCKRLLDKNACNSKCKKGINIGLSGEVLGKCRYSALFFLVEPDKYEFIENIISKEIYYGILES